MSEQLAETGGSRADGRTGSRASWPQRPVRAHREGPLASIPHMYLCGRFENTTGCTSAESGQVQVRHSYTMDGDAGASVLVATNCFDKHVDVFPVLPNSSNRPAKR